MQCRQFVPIPIISLLPGGGRKKQFSRPLSLFTPSFFVSGSGVAVVFAKTNSGLGPLLSQNQDRPWLPYIVAVVYRLRRMP